MQMYIFYSILYYSFGGICQFIDTKTGFKARIKSFGWLSYCVFELWGLVYKMRVRIDMILDQI